MLNFTLDCRECSYLCSDLSVSEILKKSSVVYTELDDGYFENPFQGGIQVSYSHGFYTSPKTGKLVHAYEYPLFSDDVAIDIVYVPGEQAISPDRVYKAFCSACKAANEGW